MSNHMTKQVQVVLKYKCPKCHLMYYVGLVNPKLPIDEQKALPPHVKSGHGERCNGVLYFANADIAPA